jgi:hypothetical protein
LLAQAQGVIARLEQSGPAWSYLASFHREYFEANAARLTRFDAKMVTA